MEHEDTKVYKVSFEISLSRTYDYPKTDLGWEALDELIANNSSKDQDDIQKSFEGVEVNGYAIGDINIEVEE